MGEEGTFVCLSIVFLPLFLYTQHTKLLVRT